MNHLYEEIHDLYENAGIEDFSKLPEDPRVVGKFVSLFSEFNDYLEAANVQGFKWEQSTYTFTNDQDEAEIFVDNNNKDEDVLPNDANTDDQSLMSTEGMEEETIPKIDKTDFLTLVQRYKEVEEIEVYPPGPNSPHDEPIPYDLKGYITEIDTGKIDSDYMNSRFEKYLKVLHSDDATEELKEQTLSELHKSFASLSQEEQKYANLFLHDVQSGDVFVEEGKTLRDYITEYQFQAKNDQIHRFAQALGLDEGKLRDMMDLKLTETTINEFGRLDD